MATYLDPVTGESFPLDTPLWRSPAGNPLMLSLLPGIGRGDIDTGVRSHWRYRAALPLDIPAPVTLGEGMTPLVEGRVPAGRVHFKLEWFAPTSSFKDRGASVMLSYLRQMGVPAILEDSSGNGGAAIAAYGAAAGLRVRILTPATAQPAKIAQMRAFGPRSNSSPARARSRSARRSGSPPRSSMPATIGRPSSCRARSCSPTNCGRIAASPRPTTSSSRSGRAATCSAATSAFPSCCGRPNPEAARLFCAQPANCAPIHAAFTAGVEEPVAITTAPTIAEGTAIKHPVRLKTSAASDPPLGRRHDHGFGTGHHRRRDPTGRHRALCRANLGRGCGRGAGLAGERDYLTRGKDRGAADGERV